MDRLKKILKTPKLQRILFIVILAIGFLAIVFRTFAYQNERMVDESIRYADASIKSVSEYTTDDDKYLVSLSFEAEGTKYTDVHIQTDFQPTVGSTVTVTYDRSSPMDCWIDPPKSFNMGLLIFYVIFGAVMITGIAGLVMISKGEKRIEQMKYRVEVEEQMQKDADEINTAKNAYYNIEPNPFENNSRYNSTELFTGGDESDYSYMMDQHSVTDSYVDAESTYGGYEGENDGQSYGANLFNDTTDYNNSDVPPNYTDSYSDPFATYSGYDENNADEPTAPYAGSPLNDTTDYNHISPNAANDYADPFAPYSGYESSSEPSYGTAPTNNTVNVNNRDIPLSSTDSYADPFAPYSGYDNHQE